MPPVPEPVIYLITGPMAAGKSTVARLLAERFERGVHLQGDFFRSSIVSGRVEMTPELSADALISYACAISLPLPLPTSIARRATRSLLRMSQPARF
jgi:cytidylate kinase